ncbi:MAG: cytochrome P450 [Sporichthyaceae bacterium]
MVREAIRLRGPVPVLGVEPTCDVEILGYALPAGTPLMLLTRLVSARGDGTPGARNFDPDRWLAGAIEARGFLSFGAGPRVCPGRGLAYLEAKTALAMLVHCFDLTPDPAAPAVRERFGMTTGPEAVRVILRQRTTVGTS